MNFPFNNKTISQKLASREENQETPRPSLKIYRKITTSSKHVTFYKS